MKSPADLLVVGGGPAGATLALLAARAGLRVQLVERASFPRDKVCGEYVAADGVGCLARLGVLDALLAAGAPRIRSVRVTDRAGRELDTPLPQPPAALGISRARLDLALLDRARAAGVAVRDRTAAVSCVLDGSRVVGCGVRESGSSSLEELRATVVAAADGRRSLLVRQLHAALGDPSSTSDASWFGHKLHLAADRALPERVELHVFDDGYAGTAPVEDGRINLCCLARAGALRRAGGSPERLLRAAIAVNPALRDAVAAAVPCGPWKSVGPLAFRARRAAAAGALFVGDAAGTIDPFCGNGISHALLAAELAAPVAVEAARAGGLTHALARAYQDSWDRCFARVTRRARLLGSLLGRPRVAGAVLAALRGPARPLAPRIVAAIRPAAHA